MAANPSILCLQDFPTTSDGSSIKLIPLDKKGKSSDASDKQTLIQELVAMVQVLTMTMADLSQVSSKEQQTNNDLAQLNVTSASSQVQKAEKAQQDLTASEGKDIFFKYILPALIAAVATAVTAIFLGPGAAAVGAAVFLLTMNIPGVGNSVTGLISKAIVDKIGKDNGWSQAKIESVTGWVNLSLAVVLAIGGGFAAGAATAATVASTAAEEVVTVGAEEVASDVVPTLVEDGADEAAEAALKVSKFASNAGKLIGIGAFASQASNSNCFYDIIYGTWASVHPDEKEKAAEWASYISTAINVLIGIIAIVAGGSGIANAAEDASNFNPILQKLEQFGFSSSKMLTYVNNLTRAGMVINAGLDGYQAYVVQNIASLRSALTTILGMMRELLETNTAMSRNSSMVNSNLQTNLENLQSLIQGLPDFGAVGKAEAQAMIQVNQQA